MLRDSQNFVHAAEQGIGLNEMQPSRVRPDVEQMARIVAWLDGWEARRKRALDISGIRKRPLTRVRALGKPQASSV